MYVLSDEVFVEGGKKENPKTSRNDGRIHKMLEGRESAMAMMAEKEWEEHDRDREEYFASFWTLLFLFLWGFL